MLRIGIVRGGQQDLFASSVTHGSRVFSHLDTEHFEPHDVLISDGIWHLDGVPRTPLFIATSLDVLYNALHESDPENSTLDELVTRHNARVVNVAHRLDHDMEHMQITAKMHGIEAPAMHAYTFPDTLKTKAQIAHVAEDVAFDLFRKLPPAWYVFGPSTLRYQVGDTAKSFHELVDHVKTIFAEHDHVYITDDHGGRDVFVFVVRDFRHESLYAFLPVERIVTAKGETYVLMRDKTYSTQLTEHAKKMHESMHMGTHGLYHYAITRRGMLCIDVIYRPIFSEGGIIEKSLEEHGVSPSSFLAFVAGIA